jgi:hypothetical protein
MTVIRSDAEWARWCMFALSQGFPLDVTAKPYKATRSGEQNNYLFGVCYPPIAEAMGYDVESIHEYMCGRHFGWKDSRVPKTPQNPNGLASVPIRSTTRDADGKRDVLKKPEFSKFVDTVQRIAAQAGVFIPDAQKAAA